MQRGGDETGRTLIFDEVDSGVGGAVAAAVGERLARLGQTTQTLVVTHSPQVAAKGDQHMKIAKTATDSGVISGTDEFDATFWGIAHAEAILIDPQHRLLLELSKWASGKIGKRWRSGFKSWSAPLAVLAARAHHTTGAGARTSQAMDAGKQLVGDGLRWLRRALHLQPCEVGTDGAQ